MEAMLVAREKAAAAARPDPSHWKSVRLAAHRARALCVDVDPALRRPVQAFYDEVEYAARTVAGAAHRKALDRTAQRAKVFNCLGTALAAFESAIRLAPDRKLYHKNRGNVLARMERWPEALTAFQTVMRLAPDDADGITRARLVLDAMGRFDEALRHHRRSLGLVRNQPSRRAAIRKNIQGPQRRARLAEKIGP